MIKNCFYNDDSTFNHSNPHKMELFVQFVMWRKVMDSITSCRDQKVKFFCKKISKQILFFLCRVPMIVVYRQIIISFHFDLIRCFSKSFHFTVGIPHGIQIVFIPVMENVRSSFTIVLPTLEEKNKFIQELHNAYNQITKTHISFPVVCIFFLSHVITNFTCQNFLYFYHLFLFPNHYK